MKKVVVVSGSPRPKGNTYKIIKEIEGEMTRDNDVSFEYLSLKRLNLAYCKGCLRCMKKGEAFLPV
jgi:multimeric flavodoxin WrbA